jgi:hypothetical protein
MAGGGAIERFDGRFGKKCSKKSQESRKRDPIGKETTNSHVFLKKKRP